MVSGGSAGVRVGPDKLHFRGSGTGAANESAPSTVGRKPASFSRHPAAPPIRVFHGKDRSRILNDEMLANGARPVGPPAIPGRKYTKRRVVHASPSPGPANSFFVLNGHVTQFTV